MSPERKQIERRKRPPFTSGYTATEASRLVDLSVAQVQAYVHAGSLEPRRGPRGELRFSFQDLVLLRTAKELSVRLPVRKVRLALRNLRRQLPRGRELTTVRITTDGTHVVARDGRAAWCPESGQSLLDFEFSDLAAEVAPLVRRTAEAAHAARESLQAEDWYELGCELETCEAEEARAAYHRAIELDPGHVDAHVNLGRLLHEAGELQRAEASYRRALELEPEDATAAYNLGVLLQDRDRLVEASLAYERAIGADPDYADAHYNLAHVSEQLGRPQNAVRHLQIYRQLTELSS